MSLTSDDVERFCKAHNVSAACPYCGTAAWTITEPTNPDNSRLGDWVIPAAPDAGITTPPPALPTLTLVCNNCFGLRLHALLPIKRWVKENPPTIPPEGVMS